MDTCDHDDVAAQARGIEELSPRELREKFAALLSLINDQLIDVKYAIPPGTNGRATEKLVKLFVMIGNAQLEVRP